MEYLSSESVMLVGSILLIAGVLIGKSSYRIGLPILLIFLLVGMGFGTDGAGIQFSDMHTAQSIGMVALCIILFSGGMGTKISAIRPVIMPGIALSTAGVLMTAFITGGFIWLLSGMEWTNIHFAFLPSLLLAATMSSAMVIAVPEGWSSLCTWCTSSIEGEYWGKRSISRARQRFTARKR